MKELEAIILEHLNTVDDDTRRDALAIMESNDDGLLVQLTNKLYNHITKDITDIDFGTIPNSRGDIESIENYIQLTECLDVMIDLSIKYRQDPTPINIVKEAIDNVRSRKHEFELGFKLDKELPINIYCTTVLAIVSSISLLIATSIEYIKDPSNEYFTVSLHNVSMRKSKDSLLFNSLNRFNTMCKKGDMDNILKSFNKSAAQNMGGVEIMAAVMAIPVFLRILGALIPYLRELIYFFYASRVRIADYLAIQSELLQMNSYEVEKNDMIDDIDRKQIADRQRSIADRLKKLSNVLDISQKTAENKAYKEIDNDKRNKYTTEDLQSDSVLF